jgi:peptidoglycan/LPS O-acetylase OafA/YrhL
MLDPRSTPAIKAHPKVDPLPALTSLRFLAAAYVMIYHYAPIYFPTTSEPAVIPLGYTGVTFFFLLSGFILAYNYRDANLADPTRRKLFYRARFARIWPTLLLALAVHLPWLFNWSSMQPQPLRALMQSGVVLAPLGIHAWVPGAACSLDCPSWSVSVEVFFYALFPILLPLVLHAPSRIAVATLAFWTASAALTTLLWQGYGGGVSLIGPEPGGVGPVLVAEFIKYFPMLHLPTFIAGLLLFALWQQNRLPTAGLLLAALAFGTLIVVLAPFIPDTILHNGVTVLAWAPLILACAAMRRGPLCTAPMIFLGKISFALYLLHIPVFAVLNTVDRVVLHGWLVGHPWTAVMLNIVASLAAATLAHLAVEEPARRWILRRGSQPVRGPVATA